MADRKQGAGLSSGSSAAGHKAHCCTKELYVKIKTWKTFFDYSLKKVLLLLVLVLLLH